MTTVVTAICPRLINTVTPFHCRNWVIWSMSVVTRAVSAPRRSDCWCSIDKSWMCRNVRVRTEGHKIRDEQGNRLTNLVLSFDVEFPDDEAGRAAYDILPRAVQQSHDRLCTVSRTVELGTPVENRVG